MFPGCPGLCTEQYMVRQLSDRTHVPPLSSSRTSPKFLCDSHMLSNGTGVIIIYRYLCGLESQHTLSSFMGTGMGGHMCRTYTLLTILYIYIYIYILYIYIYIYHACICTALTLCMHAHECLHMLAYFVCVY